jgi:hypothetical protein
MYLKKNYFILFLFQINFLKTSLKISTKNNDNRVDVQIKTHK